MIAQNQSARKSELVELVAGLEQFVEEAARQGTAAHEVEEGLFRRMLPVCRELLDRFFALQGTGDVGETFTLPDGRVLQRFAEPHARQYGTIFGEFTLHRTVYGEREGQKIEAVPLDARLQLPDSKFSHLLQSWDQLLATEQPYAQVSRVFEMILGLRQHTDSLERMSRRLSPDAEEFCWSRPVPPAKEEGEILVESADGKGVPIRHAADAPPIRDHQHRPGPKPDRKRVATVGAVYSVDRYLRGPDDVLDALFHDPAASSQPAPPRPRPQHKWSYARLNDDPQQPDPVNGQAAVFGWADECLRARLARRRKPVEVVCLMDGDESLWETKARLQEDLVTVDILDLLHVTPRLWTAAKLFHPGDHKRAELFVREQTRRILHGQVQTVIHSLRARATRRGLPAQRKAKLEQICGYFAKNQERMRYDEYLQKGYPIASGVIEGACRHVVKDRLERTGMSWTRPGAQAMLNLRAIQTCDEWEVFDKYRIKRETLRLYPYRDTLQTIEWPLAA